MSKPTKKSVTVWEPPSRVIDHSQYGDNLTYRQWCEKEAERMNLAGGSVSVVESGEYIAICRNA